MFYNYKSNFKKMNFGNTEYINNYLKASTKIDTSKLAEAISKINLNINESFSDQSY